MRRIVWMLAVLAPLGLAACGGSDDEQGSGGATGVTAPGSASAPTGSTGGDTAGGDDASLGEEGADVTLSGDIEGTFAMDDVTNVSPGEGFMAPFFLDTTTLSNMTISGETFTGTRATDQRNLNFGLSISEDVNSTEASIGFQSTNGECQITIDELGDAGSLVGSVECTDLESVDGGTTISLSATFVAPGS